MDQSQPSQSTRRPQRQQPSRHCGGFALIEVLIAILIFSLAVLGLVGLQVSMARSQTSAKFRADAAALAHDLVGTMWLDMPNRGAYRSVGGATNCASHAPCKGWEDRLHAILPGSSHEIDPDAGTGDVTIKITWQVPNEGSHQFVTTTTVTPQ